MHYATLHSLHHTTTTTATATTLVTLHHDYNFTTWHYNYNYYSTTPHYILQLWPLQPLQKTHLQPPFGPSVDSPCHPWFTTANLSYRCPIFETSATALCGTTGIYVAICENNFSRFCLRGARVAHAQCAMGCASGMCMCARRGWKVNVQGRGWTRKCASGVIGWTRKWASRVRGSACDCALSHVHFLLPNMTLKMKIFCCAIGKSIARIGCARCTSWPREFASHRALWVARIAHLDRAHCAVWSPYVRSYVHFWFLEF